MQLLLRVLAYTLRSFVRYLGDISYVIIIHVHMQPSTFYYVQLQMHTRTHTHTSSQPLSLFLLSLGKRKREFLLLWRLFALIRFYLFQLNLAGGWACGRGGDNVMKRVLSAQSFWHVANIVTIAPRQFSTHTHSNKENIQSNNNKLFHFDRLVCVRIYLCHLSFGLFPTWLFVSIRR